MNNSILQLTHHHLCIVDDVQAEYDCSNACKVESAAVFLESIDNADAY